MNIKHNKLLFVASVIDTLLGLFFIICGILEFTNALHTKANTVTETIGVQLSYLVFISSILTASTGVLSVIHTKSLRLINLRIFMGVITLAWPTFLSITLFFTLVQINIRLMSMMLASLFYMIAVLIVKITNLDFSKGVNLNPSAMIASSGKRAKSVNLGTMMSSGADKLYQKNITHVVENLAESLKPSKNSVILKLKFLFVGKRNHSKPGLFKGLYVGHKQRGINLTGFLYKNKRRRSRFRLK